MQSFCTIVGEGEEQGFHFNNSIEWQLLFGNAFNAKE